MDKDDINNGLNQMIEILHNISNKTKYQNHKKIITNIYNDITKILSDIKYADNKTLDNLEKQLNYLTDIYNENEIYDLDYFYTPIKIFCEKTNQKRYVEKLRQKHREKRKENNNAKY